MSQPINYDILMQLAEDALCAAFNADKRALMLLPAPDQLVVIQCSGPRRVYSSICRVSATLRDGAREAYVYALTSLDEVQRIESAIGAFAVFPGAAPVSIEEAAARALP